MSTQKTVVLNIASHCVWLNVQGMNLRGQPGVSITYTQEVSSSYTVDSTSFANEITTHVNSNENKHNWNLKMGTQADAGIPLIAEVKISVEASAGGEYANHMSHSHQIENSLTKHESTIRTKTTKLEITVKDEDYTNIWLLRCTGLGFWQESSILIQKEKPSDIDIPLEYAVTVEAEESVDITNYGWNITLESGDLVFDDMRGIKQGVSMATGPRFSKGQKAIMGKPVWDYDFAASSDDTGVLFQLGSWSINEEHGILVIRDISHQPGQSLLARSLSIDSYYGFFPRYYCSYGEIRAPTDEERDQNIILMQGKRWRIEIIQGVLTFRDTKCICKVAACLNDCSFKFYRGFNGYMIDQVIEQQMMIILDKPYQRRV